MYSLPYLQFSTSFIPPVTEDKHNSGCLSHIIPLVGACELTVPDCAPL